MAATKTSTEDWIEELKGISVLELSERIKALEERPPEVKPLPWYKRIGRKL